ncbi:MAG: DUF481 domain-containing protein [Bryobacteraceae bacterium]
MSYRLVLSAIGFLLCAISGVADTVTMKNGDRISGVILKSDEKTLTIKSEYAGPITVPWEAVTGIESKDPVYVGLKSGQIVVGQAKGGPDKYEIQTKETGPVVAPKESIVSIRSKEEQENYQREIDRFRNPRIVDLWAGFVDLGYATTRGNAQTSSINVSANAERATTRDKIGVHFTSLYASNDTTGVSLVTANAIRGGLNYSLNVTPKLFAFASTDLEFDQFQQLDLRFAPAGGFGYKAIKSDRGSFDLLGGASLNREFFSTGLNRTSGEILLGNELSYKLSKTSNLHEKLVFYPNVSDTGTFRLNFDTTADTKLYKFLAWQVTFSSRYLSNPVPGNKKNDILFTTGLRISFAK